MLVSTVVTHNGGTALHTRLRLQAAASSAATPHATLAAWCCSRCRLLPYSGGTLRLDQRARVALVCNMDCATAAATDNTRATPLSHHEAMECMRTCNKSPGTERTDTHDCTQPMTRSAAQYMERARCSIAKRTETYHCNVAITSLQTQTHAQHAHGASVLTVYLHSTTQQPLYATRKHSHRCAQT